MTTLERFKENLEHEISMQRDVSFIMFTFSNRESGKISDEDLIELRGYYKGLKTAKEILERIEYTEEEV